MASCESSLASITFQQEVAVYLIPSLRWVSLFNATPHNTGDLWPWNRYRFMLPSFYVSTLSPFPFFGLLLCTSLLLGIKPANSSTESEMCAALSDSGDRDFIDWKRVNLLVFISKFLVAVNPDKHPMFLQHGRLWHAVGHKHVTQNPFCTTCSSHFYQERIWSVLINLQELEGLFHSWLTAKNLVQFQFISMTSS